MTDNAEKLEALIEEVLIKPETLQGMLEAAFVAGKEMADGGYDSAWEYVSRIDFTETTRPARPNAPAPASPRSLSREVVELSRGDAMAISDLTAFVKSLDAEKWPNYATRDSEFPAGHYRTFSALLSALARQALPASKGG